MRFLGNHLLAAFFLSILLIPGSVAAGDKIPPHCRQNPVLAAQLSRMGPVLGLGTSVSQGLMARSASEIIAEQLCLGNTRNGYAFPWITPVSYPRLARYYYRRMRPRLVLALDVTYHQMKVLDGIKAKKKELEVLVAGLGLDCASDFYDCTEKGNESYAASNGYRPEVFLGDIFNEKLIDCDQRRPRKGYAAGRTEKSRQQEFCYQEFFQLNRYLRHLAAKYPNVHLLPANRIFTALEKYPYSIFYDEGRRQTFFSRKDLTWDGWHPWTDPGSYVFANLTIMQINRRIAAGKSKGRPIPLKKIADKYFAPPSGLIILAPPGFATTARPKIAGPDGREIPLRFSLSKKWAERYGPFLFGKSYFKARALAWERLGPKPLVVSARHFAGQTLFLARKDQAILSSHYRRGLSLKGGLIIVGGGLGPEIISKADTVFLNQIEKDPGILKKYSPPPRAADAAPWTYHSRSGDFHLSRY